MRSISNIMVFN